VPLLPPFRDSVALSGWLFADLMLALAMLFFAAGTGGAPPAPSPATTPTGIAASSGSAAALERAGSAGPSPLPTPTPAARPCQPTVVLDKHELHVAPGPGGRGPTIEQLKAAFRPFAGLRAGLLLSFGHAPAPAAGEELAARVNALLRAKAPAMFGADTIMEPFHYLDKAAGAVDFQVYFFARGCR
jgi:hypothetical protein